MAQNNEPAQRILLGHIITAVSIDTAWDDDLRVEVHVSCRDQHGNPVLDSSLFRTEDLATVANAVALAFEGIWRQTVPAQPESGVSKSTNAGRTTSGRSNGRH